jgi:transcriptional regulator with GAF, ATPase, and Fis domain
LILRNEIIGILYNDNRLIKSDFSEANLRILEYFASQVAIALDNALSYEKIQSLNQKLKAENLYYVEQQRRSNNFEDIIGKSDGIEEVLRKIEQVANTDSTTVLILGETGVGKEMVARAIHRCSSRQDKSFISVFCNALSDSLLPSELFGHEKGAFTGATNKRLGRFELADGGTLFLDEIGDLPLDIQIRLLRVLQSKEFERVGGSDPILSDFRLIAATNRDLMQEVNTKKFRSDLYYRINVFPILVPPLRERKDDIPLLAEHFLKSIAVKMGKTFPGISHEAMNILIQYNWPGTIRELRNVIERGVILSDNINFRLPELNSNLTPVAVPNENKNATLKDVEYQHILNVLQKTGWKIRGQGGAAELLDIHPSTLDFRIKKLGIQKPDK